MHNRVYYPQPEGAENLCNLRSELMHKGLGDPIHKGDQDVIVLGISCRERSLYDRMIVVFSGADRVIFL